MERLMHEMLQRGEETMARVADTSIVVCGAGALGANLCESLARAGATRLTVIDDDRIEARNLSTQPWGRPEVGQFKVRMLTNRLWRDLGVEARAERVRLTPENASDLLSDHDLIVDVFDNSASRRAAQDAARALGIPCLHAGMADGYGEVVWDEHYTVHEDHGVDLCDYPLARNLVMMVVAMTGEAILDFIATETQRGFTVTLGDLRVEPWRA